MKTLAFTHRDDTRFAVGAFSPVLSVFSYRELGQTVSPFLLLDHLGPGRLLPGRRPAGVNAHPHRGFETVTLVYRGEIAHQDSQGGGGLIGPGDVQWMTAGRGLVHEERFSEAFSRSGGPFELIQLWVNLPARHKLVPARYQHLRAADIPVCTLAGGAVTVRVIAGHFGGRQGPAQTHTRVGLLAVELPAGQSLTVPVPAGDTAAVYLLSGRLQLTAETTLEAQGLAVYERQPPDLPLQAVGDSRLLVLTGEPIDEPIFGQGPFVMNHFEEVLQAFEDVKQGRLR